ncbi:hypothetical protein [Hamadaea tsunoensis]|uniref:hypothetical protein n=1 Tax=Hamadaea tsunoensis TaxID=53368 RepID=UPI00047F9D51|nr:hypothetical protein [Hamadaea tsunoensis]
MSIVLRPGAAVYAVDEGLLFSGWSSGGLMSCSAGVVKLWRTVEPMLRAGADPDALRGRLPEKAGAVFDQILGTLTAHDMLMSLPNVAVPPYLACIAPDPVAAARVAASVRLRLTGAAADVSGVGPALTRAGLHIDTLRADAEREDGPAAGESPVWTVYVGGPAGAAGADVAVLVLNDVLLVGTADVLADPTVAHHLKADPIVVHHLKAQAAASPAGAGAAETAGTAESGAGADQPGPGEWAMARAVVVERVLRLCAGLTPPPVIIRGGTALPITETPEPEPGDLPQLPLAQQRVRLAGQEAVGAGADQTAAAGDARRAAMRAWTGTLAADGWSVGPIGAAGGDPLDLWTDAVGRILVAQAGRPTEPAPPDLPRSVRWRRSIARRDGREPTVSCGVTSVGAAIAVASSAQRESWGYGADRASAVEHALRGLLVDAPPPGRISVSHDAETVRALEPLLGDRRRVAEAIPGLRFEMCEEVGATADGDILAGRIGIA